MSLTQQYSVLVTRRRNN